jgi:hypothetical protein
MADEGQGEVEGEPSAPPAAPPNLLAVNLSVEAKDIEDILEEDKKENDDVPDEEKKKKEEQRYEDELMFDGIKKFLPSAKEGEWRGVFARAHVTRVRACESLQRALTCSRAGAAPQAAGCCCCPSCCRAGC